jgi:Cys-tRNA(Pro) deacylase
VTGEAGGPGLPAAARRVAAAARAAGVEIEIRVFGEGTRTAEAAAAAIGCDVAAIVKSLVFVVDDRPVVALVPGDRRLDAARLAASCGGGRARRASLDEVREATGYAAGGTPPFGHAAALEVVADPLLRRHRLVWAAAGTPTTVFAITPDDLAGVSGARWSAVAADSP